MANRLTIIIVTFNSEQIITKALQPLEELNHRIIVVDNASTDNTLATIGNNFPNVEVIANSNNIGYGKANNIALKKATSQYILILNPDAAISESQIDKSLEILDKYQNIAFASPLILHQELSQEAIEKNINPTLPEITFTNFVVGGVFFANTNALKNIGLFDENFFIFAEDNDICDRAIGAGYQNATINHSIAFHLGGKSSKINNRLIYRRFWHLGWSKSYYRKKRKGWASAKRVAIKLAVIYFFTSIYCLFSGKTTKAVGKIAFANGCLSWFIGLGAFNKNGKARG